MQRPFIHDLSDCNGRVCYVITRGMRAELGYQNAETHQRRQNRLRRERWADRQRRAAAGGHNGIEIFGG